MDQAGALSANLEESAKGFNTNHIAFDDHILFDFMPIQVEGFEHSQFDAVFFDFANPDFNFLTFLQDFFYTFYRLAGWRNQLRYMNHGRFANADIDNGASQRGF